MKQIAKLKQVLFLLFTGIILLSCSSTKKSSPAAVPADENTSLTETYWKLTELMGEPIVYSDGTIKEMHLIFKKEGNHVNGYGGCNSFMGSYTLEVGNRLSFSQLSGTLMACINLEKETAFMEALQKVDNYAIKGKVLSLNKAKMEPLAKFEGVYMK